MGNNVLSICSCQGKPDVFENEVHDVTVEEEVDPFILKNWQHYINFIE
jgi:hypothetical protein